MEYIKKKMREHKLHDNERTHITVLHVKSLNHMTIFQQWNVPRKISAVLWKTVMSKIGQTEGITKLYLLKEPNKNQVCFYTQYVSPPPKK
jgi:hypothetical protein